jgi:lysyl-tRNA synthetase class 2
VITPIPAKPATAGAAAYRVTWRPRVPAAIAWIVRMSAVLAFLALLEPAAGSTSAPFEVIGDGIAFAAAMASAGAMLLLAGALRRRTRRAWTLATGVVALGTMAHLESGRYLVAAVYGLVLAALVWTREDFTARSQPRSRLAAVRVFLVMGGSSMIAGMLLAARTAPANSIRQQVVEVFFGLMGFAPQLSFREQDFSELTQIALTTMGAVTALATLAAFLAPARKPAQLAPGDEQRLRDLLEGFGDRDSLGYFSLRRDKSVIFSKSGKAAVAYRVVGGVSLASGDPIGDPEAWPGAIEAWLAEADGYGWIPGAIGISEDGAIALRRYGLDALELGDEAVIDLAEFTLEGRPMRVVRQAVNRVQRAGYTCTIGRQGDLTPQCLAEVRAAAGDLRGAEVERGFSMALGRLADPSDPLFAIAQVRDADQHLMAVLGFAPWGQHGLSLDLMRRVRGSENGTIEFAIAQVADQVKNWGITRISLNFAVFRAVFERGSRVGAGPVLRVWLRILMIASKWFQVESLYRANAKYRPIWVPRFVSFRRGVELPRVALAAMEAEAFLARPRLPGWLSSRIYR